MDGVRPEGARTVRQRAATSGRWLALVLLLHGVEADAGWREAPVTLPPRAGACIAYDGTRGRVVLFGGTAASTRLADTWELVGATWTQGADAPAELTPRDGAAMAHDLSRGVTVLFGGHLTAQYPSDDTWEYDGAAWTRRPVNGPSGRFGHGMVYDAPRATMVLHGGDTAFDVSDETWLFDGTTWSPGPGPATGQEARSMHAMAHDPVRGVTVIYGGLSAGNAILGDVWECDGSSWQRGIDPGTLVPPRIDAASTFDAARGTVVVLGGTDGSDPLADAWEYDGSGWNALPLPSEMGGRTRSTAIHVPTFARTLVVAGQANAGAGSGDGTESADTWELASGQWRVVAGVPPTFGPRWGAAMAYDGDRARTVLFGGGYSTSRYGDTWEYDGAAWIPGAAAPPALTPRAEAAMAFHASAGVVVMYGGDSTPDVFADTWLYGPGGWSSSAATFAPRYRHAMAYHAAIDRTVLFGGRETSDSAETWLFDGASWSPGPAAPPDLEPRSDHAIAYDALRSRVVLFGGRQDTTKLDDTWELDGVAWLAGPAAPAPLGARFDHALAFHAGTGKTILHGGAAKDTWEYDGLGWLPSTGAPAGMYEHSDHAMAYDAARALVVLTSGGSDTWEYDGIPGDLLRDWIIGYGPGPQNRCEVELFAAPAPSTGADVSFDAYAAGAYGANVAGANVDGGLLGEIVTGPGPGPQFGPQVRAFRSDAQPVAKINFYAYGTLKYGVEPAGANVDADAFDELVTGAGPGAVFGPHVRGWSYDASAVAPIAGINFFAYGTLKYGVHPGSGDVEGDGFAELLTGPGPSRDFAPQIRGWNVDGAPATSIAKINFFSTWPPEYGGYPAGGDVDDDGLDEIACSNGPGGTASFAARVLGFDYDGNVNALPGFDAVVSYSSLYGARVAAGEVDGQPGAETAAALGPDPASRGDVRTYSYDGAALVQIPGAGGSSFAYGATVALGDVLP